MSTTHISFRVPDWLADALGEESNRSGMNRSEIVREALEGRLNFGGAQPDNGVADRPHDRDQDAGGRDRRGDDRLQQDDRRGRGDAAAPPDLSDALGQIKLPGRVRTTGGITTASSRPAPATRPDPDPARREWVRRRAKELHAAGMTPTIASRKALTEYEERRR